MKIIGLSLLALFASSVYATADDAASTGKIVWVFSTDEKYKGLEMATFFFKTADHKHSDYAVYTHGGMLFNTGEDFHEGDEKGAVKVLTVPAGEWELVNYTFGDETNTYRPKNDLSIPITVRPGETVYIGHYRRVWLWAHSWLMSGNNTAGMYFCGSNQSDRDIAYAKTKDPTIGDVTVAVPDFGTLKPDFKTTCPGLTSMEMLSK